MTSLKARLERLLTTAKATVRRLRRAPSLAEQLDGFQASALIFVAAELELADALRAGPRTAGELAQTLGAHAPSLTRILDALVVHGVIGRAGACYVELPVTRQLRRGARLHARALLVGHEYVAAWLALPHSARTGETAFDHVFGVSNWQHRAAHTPLNDAFNTMMATHTGWLGRRALAVVDLSRRAHVVDVGGGTGAFVAELLRANAGLSGTLFEQAHVLDAARANLDARGVLARCALVAGDFFASVPAGGDVYVLMHVLHNWDDARAQTILRAVATAMSPRAELWLIESPLPDDGLASRALIDLDIHMLAVDGGRERRLAEYRALLHGAGLELERAVPLHGPVRLMVARRR